jgi:hypothetical protein
MLRSISMVRTIVLPVMSAVAVAALPTGPAFAAFDTYPEALQACNFSHLEQVGQTSVRLFLKPESLYRDVYFARDGNRQKVGPEVARAGIVAQLGDEVTLHYSGSVPRCTMTVTTAKGRMGVELQDKDRSSWPPDIFFLPAQ